VFSLRIRYNRLERTPPVREKRRKKEAGKVRYEKEEASGGEGNEQRRF
jgi:hypothetical protein